MTLKSEIENVRFAIGFYLLSDLVSKVLRLYAENLGVEIVKGFGPVLPMRLVNIGTS